MDPVDLFNGEPGEEEAVGLDVFPVRNVTAGNFAAVAAEEGLTGCSGEHGRREGRRGGGR